MKTAEEIIESHCFLAPGTEDLFFVTRNRALASMEEYAKELSNAYSDIKLKYSEIVTDKKGLHKILRDLQKKVKMLDNLVADRNETIKILQTKYTELSNSIN